MTKNIDRLIQLERPEPGEEICILETRIGEICFRFFPDGAPKAVQNFRTLGRQGYYDGLPFNRVYTNFVIQGGALDGSGREAESAFGGFFEDECSPRLFHFRGAVSMGNAGPDTNGNQFFIVQNPLVNEEHLENGAYADRVRAAYRALGGLPHLDGRHSIFGHVTKGIELVDRIAAQEANADGLPLSDPIVIERIRFEPAG